MARVLKSKSANQTAIRCKQASSWSASMDSAAALYQMSNQLYSHPTQCAAWCQLKPQRISQTRFWLIGFLAAEIVFSNECDCCNETAETLIWTKHTHHVKAQGLCVLQRPLTSHYKIQAGLVVVYTSPTLIMPNS